MSLLLDARRKSRQAQPAQCDDHASRVSEPGLKEHTLVTGAKSSATEHPMRGTGHHLFATKSSLPQTGHILPNRNLLLALGGTILLLAASAVYLWYANSASNTMPLLRPNEALPAPPIRQMQPAAITEPAPQSAPIAEAGKPSSAGKPEKIQMTAATPAESAPAITPQPYNSGPAHSNNNPIRIEQQKTEPVDPLLRDAYLAYRSGKLDEARQLYLAMSNKDAHNPDVLLGLAAIAQQHGESLAATQYFGRILALDPRNAAANAGMSALSADYEHNESRLKSLLREQGNSTALHFALGNLYAGQSRWGEAQQAYFNAYTLEPGNAEFAFNLAVSLDHLGQKKLAAQHYQRAIQLDPSHSADFDHAQVSQHAQELTR